MDPAGLPDSLKCDQICQECASNEQKCCHTLPWMTSCPCLLFFFNWICSLSNLIMLSVCVRFADYIFKSNASLPMYMQVWNSMKFCRCKMRFIDIQYEWWTWWTKGPAACWVVWSDTRAPVEGCIRSTWWWCNVRCVCHLIKSVCGHQLPLLFLIIWPENFWFRALIHW